jgi:tetratricopeptide (TPR) repeat protein
VNDPILIVFPRGRHVPQFRLNRSLDTIRSQSDVAWNLYQEGRRLWAKRTPTALYAAIALFEKALTIDANFAAAFASLAECYAFLALNGEPPHSTMPLAKQNAERALEVDEFNAAAHAVLGFVACAYRWNWSEAESALALAVSLDSHSTSAYCWFASYLVAVGRFSEAILHCRRAQASETAVTVVTNSHVAKILNLAGDRTGALSLLLSMVDEAPQFFLAHWHLGVVLLENSELDKALSELQSAVEMSGGNASVLASFACGLGLAGRREEASVILRGLLDSRAQGKYVPASDIAAIYGYLGDFDPAFQWLDEACREKAVFLTWIRVWPLFGPLRTDPRYASFVEQLAFPPEPNSSGNVC